MEALLVGGRKGNIVIAFKKGHLHLNWGELNAPILGLGFHFPFHPLSMKIMSFKKMPRLTDSLVGTEVF